MMEQSIKNGFRSFIQHVSCGKEENKTHFLLHANRLQYEYPAEAITCKQIGFKWGSQPQQTKMSFTMLILSDL